MESQLRDDPRWAGYEIPPTSNANYAWILNMVSKLSQNGVAGFILANGALSADGTELAIRRKLIEDKLVEAIVILPGGMFYSTDISVSMWILNHNKKAHVEVKNGTELHFRDREDEILFMDLRKRGVPFEKKFIQFTPEEISEFAATYHAWQLEGFDTSVKGVPEYWHSADLAEIAEKGYSLVPSKYIEFLNRDEEIDFDAKMGTIQAEMKEILAAEEKSRNAVKALFKELGFSLD